MSTFTFDDTFWEKNTILVKILPTLCSYIIWQMQMGINHKGKRGCERDTPAVNYLALEPLNTGPLVYPGNTAQPRWRQEQRLTLGILLNISLLYFRVPTGVVMWEGRVGKLRYKLWKQSKHFLVPGHLDTVFWTLSFLSYSEAGRLN